MEDLENTKKRKKKSLPSSSSPSQEDRGEEGQKDIENESESTDNKNDLYSSSSHRDSSLLRPSSMPSSVHPRAAFNACLQQAVYPHVRSFDTFAEVYVQEMVKDLPVFYVDPNYEPEKHEANPYYTPSDYIKLAISSVSLGPPVRFDSSSSLRPDLSSSSSSSSSPSSSLDRLLLLPRQCRESHLTYGSPLKVSFLLSRNKDGSTLRKDLIVGLAPLMVKSNLCTTR
ncbi:dna-directed rna polymerase i subunit, partial [Cystoisospora suis]